MEAQTAKPQKTFLLSEHPGEMVSAEELLPMILQDTHKAWAQTDNRTRTAAQESKSEDRTSLRSQITTSFVCRFVRELDDNFTAT